LDFDLLYRRYSGSIFKLALRLLGDKEMALDATQETFLKAYESRDSFRGEARASTWLYRIAYNHSLSRLRERPRTEGLEPADRPDSPQGRPPALAESSETGEEVRKALSALGEEDRRLLCLQGDGDLDYAELAEILGCTRDAVRARVCRARRRLREILGPLLEERP